MEMPSIDNKTRMTFGNILKLFLALYYLFGLDFAFLYLIPLHYFKICKQISLITDSQTNSKLSGYFREGSVYSMKMRCLKKQKQICA